MSEQKGSKSALAIDLSPMSESDYQLKKGYSYFMAKIVGTVLFAVGLVLAIKLVNPWSKEDPLAAKVKRFETLWVTDLENLRVSKSLPPAFDDIAEVEYKSPDPLLQKIVATTHPNWNLKKTGKFNLQLFLDQLPNENGTIVRYDLIERSSGNTVWELSRTLSVRINVPGIFPE